MRNTRNIVDHVRTAMAIADSATEFSGACVEGMTSTKVRCLLNSLCIIHGGHYMEVGTWKGATLLSACHGANLDKATVIDNWSTFGGPREEFYANVNKFKASLPALNVLDRDCWEVDPETIKPKVDIFFYDGHHSESGQKRAITHFWEALAKPAIIVVDDWDDPNYDVPRGTREGLAEVGADILLEFERHAKSQADATGWWNGVFLCVAK